MSGEGEAKPLSVAQVIGVMLIITGALLWTGELFLIKPINDIEITLSILLMGSGLFFLKVKGR